MPGRPAYMAARFTGQLLAGTPAGDVESVAERLLAVQAQDFRAVKLAIRARSEGLSAADVDTAFSQRSILINWLNRGTLHLVRAEDHAWLHALTAPTMLTANASRLKQEGVSPGAADRGVAVVTAALSEDGPLTRGALRERLDAAGVRTQGQALVHLLFLASLRGIIARGPVVNGEQAFVLLRDWLGDPPPVDRGRALAELARRYLAGHGPADAHDLARWAGLPLRDARAGLSAIAPELVQHPDGLVDLARRVPPDETPPRPRLLGGFDAVLMGWRSREPILGKHTQLVTMNGMFKPFALVAGRAAGTWRLSSGAVQIEPFRRLSGSEHSALRADADDIVRFLK